MGNLEGRLPQLCEACATMLLERQGLGAALASLNPQKQNAILGDKADGHLKYDSNYMVGMSLESSSRVLPHVVGKLFKSACLFQFLSGWLPVRLEQGKASL